MQILINIPDEQIEKSLAESKNIHEDEGEKGSVDIVLLYTNGQLDFVDVSRKTDFYSCKYEILPKSHGRILIVSEDVIKEEQIPFDFSFQKWVDEVGLSNATISIIDADRKEQE